MGPAEQPGPEAMMSQLMRDVSWELAGESVRE